MPPVAVVFHGASGPGQAPGWVKGVQSCVGAGAAGASERDAALPSPSAGAPHGHCCPSAEEQALGDCFALHKSI